MDSSPQNASWHPAMMPNSSSELDHHEAADQESATQHPPISQALSVDTPEFRPSSSGGALLDQVDDDDEAGAAAWDLSTPAQTHTPIPSQTESSSAQDGNFIVTEPAETGNTAKHMSTMSFARTVSHEMSFNDDDEDPEWNIQRSETNPFQFMPENQRTNSFPDVPREAHATDEYLPSPPPATQAEEILHDLEQEDDHADISANMDPEESEDSMEQPSGGFGQSMGGEMPGREASDARFEEGLPLIAQEESEQAGGITAPAKSDTADLFSQVHMDDGGDDFFSQTHYDSDTQHGGVSLKHSLQRKSTTMVIGEADDELPSPTEDVASKDLAWADSTATDIAKPTAGSEDLDARWAAAFGDDDDEGFLLDTTEAKELDPADVFGSDDEGFLDDAAEQELAVPQPAQPAQPAVNGRYTPQPQQFQQHPAQNPYLPSSALPNAMLNPQRPQFNQTTTAPPGMGFAAPPPKPDLPKTQSFASKSKGGYQSPYDLPMDVVKPKKRASAQQLPRASPTLQSAPPRSASTYSQPPLSGGSVSSLSPPSSGHSNQQPTFGAQKPNPQLRPKSSFFEDLPVTQKVRPSSRQNNISSTQVNPYAQLQTPPTAPPARPTVAPLGVPPQVDVSSQQTPGASLVAPERVSPYVSLQSDPIPRPQPPSTVNNRYSPAPAAGSNGTASAGTRYSPAPNSRSSSGSYSAVPPPMLAHQPRTSSPLAHFEVSHDQSGNRSANSVNGDGVPLLRSSSSQYDHRVTRVSSLPPTQEVEEEPPLVASPGSAPKPVLVPSSSGKYSPSKVRHTPPPIGNNTSNPLSPPKRSTSNYAPQPVVAMPPKEVNFVPPPRSQTQSPGVVYGNRTGSISSDSAPRPSSAHAPTSPQTTRPTVRARGMSQHLNLVAPTDGRELDPLQRWRGAPCFSWGVGGVFVSTFPKDIPRYGISSNVPQITRSPGEVKVKHMKDIQPLEERLAKFPGPLKGKSKKKEVLAWLTAGIDTLEKAAPNVSFQQHVSHDDKRAIERVLLWKILRVLVENDGTLEGNPAVEKAVREVISPGLDVGSPEVSSAVSSGMDLTGMASVVNTMQADAVNASAIESLRRHLLLGEREKAVWAAVDKRLWGHALLLSGSVENSELYRQVAQEFVKKEVNHAGQGNQSLAALYGVLSGNFDEAVDELVPVHARAGMQLMSASSSAISQDALIGLDKWRETLGMILSNRRQGDGQALRSLGNLLSGYGRAEASHICFIFARTFAIFGGLDDPNANFVLLGADHRRQADQFAKETEALQLSEVYEYGLSLAPGSNAGQPCAHLAAYKLQHAMILSEYGFRDKALQYCEGISTAINAQTKKSSYYHPGLEEAVVDFAKRLKQAPGDDTSSWIPKIKKDQVSSSMWSRFNKFVAGDDENGTGNGGSGEGGAEVGPFARIAGGTPSISRAPSVSNFEVLGTSPSFPNKASSLYAPAPALSGNSPYEPKGAYAPSPYSSDAQIGNGNPYAPASYSNPLAADTPYQPQAPYGTPEALPYASNPQVQLSGFNAEPPSDTGYPGYQPFDAGQNINGASTTSALNSPETVSKDETSNGASLNPEDQSFGGYDPPSMNTFKPSAEQSDFSTGGYEPPSYQPSSFEPPSYEAGPMDDNDVPEKPKKKSFMDDDDDDIPGLQPAGKSKAEKDQENEEMFRKIAEEEAKRADEAKAAKKGGWGISGWFGGGKKDLGEQGPKAIKAKLGEASSFVYDPDLKRWVDKKAGNQNAPAKTSTPPPPRAMSTPPPSAPTSVPPMNIARPPLPGSAMGLSKTVSHENLNMPTLAPPMARSVSGQSNASAAGGPPSAPPSRPTTSLSNASSIDDLIGAAGPRKGGKKPRKSGRYVDVMAK
ncbi:Sec23-binding domain of Sec16-domain-containing protein [Xylariaceae sp. FL0255]|nr:Sec23-binding domain of Sec16-domain-containing protein [Xylariaceae sp. FL0255]